MADFDETICNNAHSSRDGFLTRANHTTTKVNPENQLRHIHKNDFAVAEQSPPYSHPNEHENAGSLHISVSDHDADIILREFAASYAGQSETQQ